MPEQEALKPGVGEDLGIARIVYFGVMGTAIIVIAILAVEAAYHWSRSRRVNAQQELVEFPETQTLQGEQIKLLRGRSWVVKDQIATIPIEAAMAQVAAEH